MVTSVINCLTSFLAGFVVFSVLGYMALLQGRDIDKVAVEGQYRTNDDVMEIWYVLSNRYIYKTMTIVEES